MPEGFFKMIRRYKESDLEAVMDTWLKASRIAHEFMEDDFFLSESELIRHKYIAMVETWVYEISGDVVGFISLLDGEVAALFIYPENQRDGIGSLLLELARRLKGNLMVNVFKKNRGARAFYEEFGFEFVSEKPYKDTGEIMVRMAYKVV